MPLNEVGRRYAEKLYLSSSEAIAKQYVQEVAAVRADHERRNMVKSGAYISAHSRVIVKQIRLLAEARADAFLRAYEKSGLPFDDAGLAEVTAWVAEFCGHQQDNAVHAIGRIEQQVFGGQTVPPGLDKAVVGDIQREITAIIPSVSRTLSLKRDEAVLGAAGLVSSQGAAQPTPEGAPPKAHLYYWRICKRFGAECYHTWRTELLASFIVSIGTYFVSKGEDPSAWRNFRVALISIGFTLAAFALGHLVRTPWLVHRVTIGAEESNEHWGFGVLGAVVLVGVLGGGAWYWRQQIAITPPPVAQPITEQSKPPLVIIQILNPIPSGMTPGKTIFKAGKLTIGFHFLHSGPNITAQNFWAQDRIIVEPTATSPTTKLALENAIYDEFRTSISPSGTADLAIGQDRWGTHDLTLSKAEAGQLVKGDKTLYALQYAEFVDANGKHSIEACKWLQPPGDAPVWHLCGGGHNKIK